MRNFTDQMQNTSMRQNKRSLAFAQQTKLFENRDSAIMSSTNKESKTKVEMANSEVQSLEEPPAWDLECAIKRMKDEDFFKKEFAKDLRKHMKERDGYI